MGGQQQSGGADETTPGRSASGTPATGAEPDARATARAEKRAQRQRRQEERRRRWARGATPATTEPGAAEAGAVEAEPAAVAAGGGGTAVLTRPRAAGDGDPDTVGAGTPRPGGPDDVAPATSAPVVPARGPAALWQLVLTAHPRQAVVTGAALAGAAALAGRPAEEIGLLGATALVGQGLLGWHNDLVDRDRDAAAIAAARDRGDETRRRRKPIAEGRLEPGTVWYAFVLGLLLLVPLSISNGVLAGASYLVAWAVGLLGNISLRGGWFSWVPWAASFALYPAVLAYAAPPGTEQGGPPQPALVAIAAGLGVVVHVLRALPGLVDDHREGRRHLPLRVALRTGAPRLLGLAGVLGVGLVIALVTVAAQQGLVR